MIVPARINYFKALEVTGLKFLLFFDLTFLISICIRTFQWLPYLIPERYIMFMASALGIFLGFRINAAYSRWRDGHGIFRDLMSSCLSYMTQITVLTKSKSESLVELYQLKTDMAVLLLRYVHLVRLELSARKPRDWHALLKPITFNEVPLFPDSVIEHLLTKRRKGSYVLSQLSNLIHISNVEGKIIYVTTGEVAKSLQRIIELEQTLVSLKSTPFPWGYQFYTRLFVWMLPFLFMFSALNQLHFIDNIVMSLISTMFVTTEQIARNLDDPVTNFINGVPFNYLCRMLEIELLESLDTPHNLQFVRPVKGILS